MNRFNNLLFLGNKNEPVRWRAVVDTVVALIAALVITSFIYVLHLYPLVRNVSLLYLIIVWGLAVKRGLYAAIMASIFAFLSFDFFLVPPLYTFTVNAPEEWLALFVFLATAVATGWVAAKLRQSVEDANNREQESRALYNLMSAVAEEVDVERQLSIVAHSLVDVFSDDGVRSCVMLLPDKEGKLTSRVSAGDPEYVQALSDDEEVMIKLVMQQGEAYELHDVSLLPGSSAYTLRTIVHSTAALRNIHRYIRFSPLTIGERVVGVARTVIEEGPHLPTSGLRLRTPQTRRDSQAQLWHWLDQVSEHMLDVKREQGIDSQQSFFEAFLDQAAAIIERGRLRDESMEVEVLRRTDALRAALLSSVSHDLRTPLASIKVAAGSLQQQDVEWDEETRRGFAATIEHEADRLNRLVGNILDMSRIEGGALKPEKELYPIDELVHDVLNHMQFVLRGRQVEVTIPDDLPPVELDYLQMDQVLTNLLENAVRYTPAGSPIEIEARYIGDKIEILISDHGPGIPAQDTERIFDKFYRVMSPARKSTMGTGLGLAVCRGLVEAHGGRIWAENREGGGAVFRLTLPVLQPEKQTGEHITERTVEQTTHA